MCLGTGTSIAILVQLQIMTQLGSKINFSSNILSVKSITTIA